MYGQNMMDHISSRMENTGLENEALDIRTIKGRVEKLLYNEKSSRPIRNE